MQCRRITAVFNSISILCGWCVLSWVFDLIFNFNLHSPYSVWINILNPAWYSRTIQGQIFIYIQWKCESKWNPSICLHRATINFSRNKKWESLPLRKCKCKSLERHRLPFKILTMCACCWFNWKFQMKRIHPNRKKTLFLEHFENVINQHLYLHLKPMTIDHRPLWSRRKKIK